MKFIWIIALIVTGCRCLNLDSAILPDAFITLAPPPVTSLFVEDTCAPPCWFGLTAGESTAAEVQTFLESHADLLYWNADFHSNVFDPQSGVLLDGNYYAQWRHFDRPNHRLPEMFLVVEDSILIRMATLVPQIVPVDEVLVKLGQPDIIRFGFELYGEPIIIFEYHSIPVRVFFTGDSATCDSMIGLVDNVWVDSVDYLPPDAPAATIWQESLLGRLLILPPETWERWRRNEVEDISCDDMVRQLLDSDNN